MADASGEFGPLDPIGSAVAGARLGARDALALVDADHEALIKAAALLRDRGHGQTISYSRKVFIPLTRLCRDVCHYCTFSKPPRRGERAFLSPDEVLQIARAGAKAGCREALFTLGDKPEARYAAARDELQALGHETTLSYLRAMAELVHTEAGLLPHLNAGLMTDSDYEALRAVSISMGLMLETTADRLSERGGPHFGSPDKAPGARIEAIAAAGRKAVPFTTGLLIGIGETRAERIDALLAIRDLHERYGHIQETIIQNFDPKAGTKMAQHPPPAEHDLLWTIAAARLVLGAEANIQTPPNLNPGRLAALVSAGINDWGGVSPITPDHVNPDHAWPTLERLAEQTAAAGKILVERLAVYPATIAGRERWLDARYHRPVLGAVDATGFVRDQDWFAGITPAPPPAGGRAPLVRDGAVDQAIARALSGARLQEAEIVTLFRARGEGYAAVCSAANDLRRVTAGDVVTYVVNRNINYTNICTYRCGFCAFSKGKTADHLRGRPYKLDLAEVERRTAEAWSRGATEVCLQGGIHPEFTGDTYLEICRAVKAAAPGIHVHAFSPLEISHGAATLGLSVTAFLEKLASAGLGSLPGTAAEILDDAVRAVICADKINTSTWLSVVESAHQVGLPTTATIMFGHVDAPVHWGRHLLHVRDIQERTGGITEFVPLPFVAEEAPLFLKGKARAGPTYREAVLMHAVARLVLHPLVHNIQTSWVKMGRIGAQACLDAGANDLGGVLMDESITRAAGAGHGQEVTAAEMRELITQAGREPRQRRTTYALVDAASAGA